MSLGKIIFLRVPEGYSDHMASLLLQCVREDLKRRCQNERTMQWRAADSARLLDLDAMKKPVEPFNKPAEHEKRGYNAALRDIAGAE